MELKYRTFDLRFFNPYKQVRGIVGPVPHIMGILQCVAAVRCFMASKDEWCLIHDGSITPDKLEVTVWDKGVLINREVASKIFNGVLDKTIQEEVWKLKQV